MIDGFTARSARANGIELSYQIGGIDGGTPVLLWHGFLGESTSWRKVAPLLAERGCSVLVPDMRGYGASAKPSGTAGYDGLNLVADFRALAAALGFARGRRLIIVAHDMGAPPALLWAGTYPHEIGGLAYLEEPLLLPDLLAQHIAYTDEGTRLGGLWWWFMALAGDMPQRLIADGRERAFLTWFYENYSAAPDAIEPSAVDAYVEGFRGEAGVAGAFGVYRAVRETARQTAQFLERRIATPILALGGEKSQGESVRESLLRVATNVAGGSVAECGHFIPEEKPEELVRRLEATVLHAR